MPRPCHESCEVVFNRFEARELAATLNWGQPQERLKDVTALPGLPGFTDQPEFVEKPGVNPGGLGLHDPYDCHIGLNDLARCRSIQNTTFHGFKKLVEAKRFKEDEFYSCLSGFDN